jgi:hypothetical protein
MKTAPMDLGDDYTLGTGMAELPIQTAVSDAFGDSYREGLIRAHDLLTTLRESGALSLVDLGTGPGLSLRIGMEILQPGHARGTDTALFDWLDAARRTVGRAAQLTDDDVRNLQVEDGSVHALSGRLILGHLKNHPSALRHWAGKLADKGVMTLTEFAGVSIPPAKMWPENMHDVRNAVIAYYDSYEQAWAADGKDLFAGFALAYDVARGELPDERLVHGEANLTPIPKTLEELAYVFEQRLKGITDTWRKVGRDDRAEAIQAIVTPEILDKMRAVATDWDGVRWIASTVVLQKGESAR